MTNFQSSDVTNESPPSPPYQNIYLRPRSYNTSMGDITKKCGKIITSMATSTSTSTDELCLQLPPRRYKVPTTPSKRSDCSRNTFKTDPESPDSSPQLSGCSSDTTGRCREGFARQPQSCEERDTDAETDRDTELGKERKKDEDEGEDKNNNDHLLRIRSSSDSDSDSDSCRGETSVVAIVPGFCRKERDLIENKNLDMGRERHSRRRVRGKSTGDGSRNGLQVRTGGVFLKTFHKVLTSYNCRRQQNAPSLKPSLATLQNCDPVYHRVVYRVIATWSRDPRSCTAVQKDMVLQSLGMVAADPAPATDSFLRGGIDDVLSFLLTHFHDTLRECHSDYDRAGTEDVEGAMKCLKMIVIVVGAIAHKADYFMRKIERRQVFRRLIDDLFTASSVLDPPLRPPPLPLPLPAPDSNRDVMTSLKKMALKGLLVHALLVEVREVLMSLSSVLSVPHSPHHDLAPCAMSLSCHLDRVQDVSAVLSRCRESMSVLVKRQRCLTTEHKIQLKRSHVIPLLATHCLLHDLESVSHALKIFVMFSEQPVLQKLLLRYYSAEFATLFLATMRAEEITTKDVLMKFWLCQRLCKSASYRNFLFRANGVLMEILRVLMAVELPCGEALEVLAPLCRSDCDGSTGEFPLDMSLTATQLIQQLGGVFLSGGSREIRLAAGNVLMVFTEGLEREGGEMSRCFLESGLLYGVMNVVSTEECECEWRERGSFLLCALLEDDEIRRVFLVEHLGVFQCLASSADSLMGKCTVLTPLLAALLVVARDPLSHFRLFESNVLLDLAGYIRDVTMAADELCSGAGANAEGVAEGTSTQGEIVLHSLEVFDIIASSGEASRITLVQLGVDSCLELLSVGLREEAKEPVREAAGRVLDRIRGESFGSAGSAATLPSLPWSGKVRHRTQARLH